ncbi:hypothetical protein AFLA_001757 [Aspergillus flavus NRRL3357]|nr:hypothetical protein AFLA_001757 [Aspergillus flavus NRRL3357]
MDKHKDAIIRQSSTQRSGFDNIPVLLLLWYYGARFISAVPKVQTTSRHRPFPLRDYHEAGFLGGSKRGGDEAGRGTTSPEAKVWFSPGSRLHRSSINGFVPSCTRRPSSQSFATMTNSERRADKTFRMYPNHSSKGSLEHVPRNPKLCSPNFPLGIASDSRASYPRFPDADGMVPTRLKKILTLRRNRRSFPARLRAQYSTGRLLWVIGSENPNCLTSTWCLRRLLAWPTFPAEQPVMSNETNAQRQSHFGFP